VVGLLQSHAPRTISPGQRYIHHIERGSNGLLLVREENKGGGVTLPFLCLGFADYMSHQGERQSCDPLAPAQTHPRSVRPGVGTGGVRGDSVNGKSSSG
jgi:hypothetical protein